MMSYSTFVPTSSLQPYVDCYWIVEGTDQTKQKIIPDGFSEMIFHYHDHYVITTDKICERQSLSLLAGQLDAPIFLQPTGKSGVFGIKFKPSGMWKLFGFEMSELKNGSIPMNNLSLRENEFDAIPEKLHAARSNHDRVRIIEQSLRRRLGLANQDSLVDAVLLRIQSSKGKISIEQCAAENRVSLRKLERRFKQEVGISAKLFSRLVRFNNVFTLLQCPNLSKSDVAYLAGYFDQAHFNREFKEFSGENPESWIKQNHAFAEFFLAHR